MAATPQQAGCRGIAIAFGAGCILASLLVWTYFSYQTTYGGIPAHQLRGEAIRAHMQDRATWRPAEAPEPSERNKWVSSSRTLRNGETLTWFERFPDHTEHDTIVLITCPPNDGEMGTLMGVYVGHAAGNVKFVHMGEEWEELFETMLSGSPVPASP